MAPNRLDWDDFLQEAYLEAQDSRDPSTQNGAVIITPGGRILTKAANNFPDGVAETEDRWERPAKYFFIEHAERNAVLNLARSEHSALGKIMVCPWAACADCARAIVQSGISTLVRHRLANAPETTPARWDDSIVAGDAIMIEAGIQIIEVDPVAGYKLRRNGELKDTSEL